MNHGTPFRRPTMGPRPHGGKTAEAVEAVPQPIILEPMEGAVVPRPGVAGGGRLLAPERLHRVDPRGAPRR